MRPRGQHVKRKLGRLVVSVQLPRISGEWPPDDVSGHPSPEKLTTAH